MQAWLDCNDLFTRAKNAMYGYALELFDEQLSKGNIAVQGKFLKFEDYNMQGKDEFLMLSLLNDMNSIVHFMDSKASKADPKLVARYNEFKEAMEMVAKAIGASKTFDYWASEALLHVKEKSITELISNTINDERAFAIESLLSVEKTRKDSVFTEQELNLLEHAIEDYSK